LAGAFPYKALGTNTTSSLQCSVERQSELQSAYLQS